MVGVFEVLGKAQYPVYVLKVTKNNKVLFGGGGGPSKCGIPNGAELHNLDEEFSLLSSGDTETRAIMSLAISPDEKSLVFGVDEFSRSFTFPALESTGSLKQTDQGDGNYQKLTRFTKDGTILITGGSEKILRFWTFPNFQLIKKIQMKDEIRDLCFSESNDTLCCVCSDGIATIFNFKLFLSIYAEKINCLQSKPKNDDPDEDAIDAKGLKDKLKDPSNDILSKEEDLKTAESPEGVEDIEGESINGYEADDEAENDIIKKNMENNGQVENLISHVVHFSKSNTKYPITACGYFDSDFLLVASHPSRGTYLITIDKTGNKKDYYLCKEGIVKFNISTCGRFFAVGSRLGAVLVFERESKRLVTKTQPHTWFVTGIEFTSDSTKVISTSSDCLICASDVHYTEALLSNAQWILVLSLVTLLISVIFQLLQ